MDEITCKLTELCEERKKLQKKLTSINREIERLEKKIQSQTIYKYEEKYFNINDDDELIVQLRQA